jgi:hypothetical protein
MRRLPVAASVVPSSLFLVTLMTEALCSSETSVLTRAIRRNIPEDTNLNSYRRENLKSSSSEGTKSLSHFIYPPHLMKEIRAIFRKQGNAITLDSEGNPKE